MVNIAVSHTAARGSIPRIGITFLFLGSLYLSLLIFGSLVGSFLFLFVLILL